MSIRKKIMLILAGVVVSYSAVQYGIEQLIVMPSFVALQQAEARKDLSRCVNAIRIQTDAIVDMTADWSHWDDTYKFVKDENNDYVESNLAQSTFAAANLNLLHICNPEGKVVWGKVYDQQSETYIAVAEFPETSLDKDHILLKHRSVESSIEGLYLTEQGPMLVSSMPILTSEGEGPIRGTLIMGRFLDKDMVQGLSEDLSVDFRVDVVGDLNNMLRRIGKTEEALRAREEQYRGIFEATTDGLRIGTLDGQIVEVNQAFARMHGYSREEIAALSPKQWIHPDSHSLFEQFVAAVKSGKAFQCEGRDVRKDGSVFDVEIHGIPWNYQGEQHTLTVLRDITERKQLYETLDRKQRNPKNSTIA